MEIVEEKFYKTASGHKVGPMMRARCGVDCYYWLAPNLEQIHDNSVLSWGEKGNYYLSFPSGLDIVAEWIDDDTDMIHAAAKAVERALNPQWDDEQFEIWWNSDAYFTKHETSWGYFTGTRKQHRIWQTEIAVRTALAYRESK